MMGTHELAERHIKLVVADGKSDARLALEDRWHRLLWALWPSDEEREEALLNMLECRMDDADLQQCIDEWEEEKEHE